MINLLAAAACHMIGDFGFQPDWMGKYKATSWEINGYHAATYTSVFVLAGANAEQAAALFATHFFIDPIKARWKIIDKIWVDQLLHGIVILGLFGR